MNPSLTLISHPLCPYVQRAAIVLHEKAMAFGRRDIDLADKPGWFLEISPLGKTPVLLVDDHAIFESAVICEYLDDTLLPRLHPEDPLERARHRAYMEFGSAILNTIGRFYNASDDDSLAAVVRDLRKQFVLLEGELGSGPYFGGGAFRMVDAVFGPVFRYFDVFDTIQDFGIFDDLPKVVAWRRALAVRPSVRNAAAGNYPQLLAAFLIKRQSALSRRMASTATQ
jgi:glutathione S-transferase